MESLITKESPYCFENLTVLNYDSDENNALFIAKTAELVHSDTTQKEGTTNYSTQKKYALIRNLFFRKPQHTIYDLVTVYNPYMLNKKNIILHLKNIHDYLTPSGKFCGFIRTQTNNISVPEQAFATVYSQIYQLTHHKTEQTITSEDLLSAINLKSECFTDDELKEIIWSNGYDIISYKNKIYETAIYNTCEYKKTLKSTFIHNIRHHNLSETTIKQLKKQFIKLITKESKRNNLNQLIESWNFTKITLCKANNLRPTLFINNSLLSTEWTEKNYEK